MARTPERRPRGEAERRRVFWAVAGAVLVGLAILIVLQPEGDGDDPTPASTTTTTTAAPTVAQEPAPLPTGEPVPVIAGQQVSTLPPVDARAPARAFVRSWLRYAHGLGSLDAVVGASPACLAQIRSAGQNPAHPGGEPRVVALRASRERGALWIYARIDDDSRYGAYPVAFELVKRDGEWLCGGLIEET